jgi:D-apionolactonase
MPGVRAFGAGRLTASVVEGDLRAVRFAGHEVLRRVSYPVRDADWGTCPVVTRAETLDRGTYVHRFDDRAGAFSGVFRAEMRSDGVLSLSIELRFGRAMVVNRAGFTLLHPISGVAGTPMRITHPDGSVTEGGFPLLISPGQPARDIAGLSHRVGPVAVDIAFSGEVFEMEDQRNWSDASFKTYCRPLSQPRPFAVAADEVLRQEIVLRFEAGGDTLAVAAVAATGAGRMPKVMLAHQPGLSTTAALAGFPRVPVLVRVDHTTPDSELGALSPRDDVAVEIVFSDLPDLDRQIARITAAGLRPVRVIAMPVAYLASHQPEGPWPAGPAPRDAIAPLRAAFPGVLVGSGSLTNFTEFNRCRPDPSADDVTFGNTAIVHAADDQSVRETLEALPAIFATAAAVAPGKPMHLGLFSIGMRSNPYGRDVIANPDGARLPMAMRDPRQTQGFAAAYALGVLLAAARGGVDSIALAMPDGHLGAAGAPLGGVIRAAAGLGGQPVEWRQDGALHVLAGGGITLVAAIGPDGAGWAGRRLEPDSAVVMGAAA